MTSHGKLATMLHGTDSGSERRRRVTCWREGGRNGGWEERSLRDAYLSVTYGYRKPRATFFLLPLWFQGISFKVIATVRTSTYVVCFLCMYVPVCLSVHAAAVLTEMDGRGERSGEIERTAD